MSPREFQIFTENLFTQLGYDTKVTKLTCDSGKNVIATNSDERIYIECKHWSIKYTIDKNVLKKLVKSVINDGATRAIVITTTKYNRSALEYAKRVYCLELWTIKDVIKALNKIEDAKKGYIFNCLEG
ncbi:restriction endonuclease [Clostridium botulinum D/C]|nr:restriction endonuclease [Clostridium botulinum D/C]MCD3324893.1 restriction endonuclease [Clostridium botulinum D/C]MCD3327723.1 restriction endonuclease [Clostridium botulinum D/C]